MDEIETIRVLEIAIDNATSRGDTRVILHPTRAKQILAALEAAREDAERYRWLRQSHWYVGIGPDGDTEGVSLCSFYGAELDAAIDQARSDLDAGKTVLQEVGGSNDYVAVGSRMVRIETFLEQFLFPGAMKHARIASLSGGALGELLDWLLGLVDAPESGDGNDGEGNPTADPSG